MAKFTVYNLEGAKVGEVEQPVLFTTPVDDKLIHRYFTWVRNQLRTAVAHTKTRGDVRGGGKKPWKQKGTGRARVGSSRSPLWRKGGTIFGPLSTDNWATRMPRAERRKALFSALAAKAVSNKVVVIEEWNMAFPKTKDAVTVITKLPIEGKKVLHIGAQVDDAVARSTRNIQGVTSVSVETLNIIDLLNSDTVLFTKESLERLEKHFTTQS